ncbi:MAG TPA: hypothetical protein ENJ57_04870 [Rhizobiales bacterium]|nr:hypothetical protein [Hyphomicrobiales bacterium]
MAKVDLPSKEVRRLLKKIAPDLKALIKLMENSDEDHVDSVIEDSIVSGARNLLIARKIIKQNR